MKMKIIFLSILSVLILTLLPSINAIELNLIKENNNEIVKEFLTSDLNIIKKYINIEEDEINDIISSPLCFAIPYAILTFLILCVVFGIIGVFGTAIAFIVNILIGMVTSIFGAFIGILSLFFRVIVTIMNGAISTITEIFSIISTFTAILVELIKEKFINLREFIILLIGLTIDILKLIYDTIFPNTIIN